MRMPDEDEEKTSKEVRNSGTQEKDRGTLWCSLCLFLRS
jgi:hypothetical protein